MRNSYFVTGRLKSLTAAVVLVLLLAGGVSAQSQTAPAITVTVNKSMVFRLAERAKRVSVSQPEVADVLVVAPSQLLINGKNVGTTSLIIFDEKGGVSNYDLIVAPDIAAARAQLRSVFPNEKVDISTSGPSLVLRGEVSNEVVYDRVLEIAATYLPPKPPAQVSAPSASQTFTLGAAPQQSIPTAGVGFAGGGTVAFNEETSITDPYRWPDKKKIDGIIDLLVIKEVRQIELDVVVAEVALNKLREIGLDAFLRTGNVNANSLIGSNAFGLLGNSNAGLPSTFNVPPLTGSFSYVNGATQLLTLYRAFQNKDVAQILAQPKLVVKNGRQGGFLAGGEFPVVAVTANTFGVIFKPFGVRLDFIPTLTWSDRIDLRVFPEVSQISSTVVNGVPGVEVRRTVSRVELAEGESLIIGGLLDQRIVKDLNKFPVLGDIPILGALFRSTKF
ncbi:MAG: type II and III secretion system protein family protein, partial [Candidatus Binatia bacterium]